jgi:hypothetical protein
MFKHYIKKQKSLKMPFDYISQRCRMKSCLCEKLNFLSSEKRSCFFNRLYNILNDRYNSFVYGGISTKEYANPPKEKIEIAEEKLYDEMFGDQDRKKEFVLRAS